MSATPILDLEILPPELRTSKLPLIIGGIIGIFLGVSPLLPPSWHTFSGLWLIPALYVAVAVHELGHLVAGKSVGMNVGGVVIGGFRIFKSGKRWTCQFDWRQAMAGGLAKPLPPTSDVSLAQFAWMIAGGPLASILLTLATGAITLRYGGGAGGWRDYLFWVALLTISSLIPGSAGPNRSDGAQLWMLLRRPEQCRSWIALLKIQTEEAEGVLPADWDASLVAEMLTAEPMSAEYSYCQLLTYYRRADQGDDLEAVQHLENALGRSERCGILLRHYLFLEAAFASAIRRQNAGNARVWMERARKLRRPESEASVDAAIGFCEGRYEDAIRHLSQARAWLDRRKLDSGLARFARKKYIEYERRCLDARDSVAQKNPTEYPATT